MREREIKKENYEGVKMGVLKEGVKKCRKTNS